MIENKLETTFAPPIELETEFKDTKLTFLFDRVNVGHRAFFRQKFGKNGIESVIASLNLNQMAEVLFYLLPKEEKEKLDEIKDLFKDYDENDQEISLAPKRIDRFKFILGEDLTVTMELFFNCLGTTIEEVKQKSKELESLPEGKKKELEEILTKMTGR